MATKTFQVLLSARIAKVTETPIGVQIFIPEAKGLAEQQKGSGIYHS